MKKILERESLQDVEFSKKFCFQYLRSFFFLLLKKKAFLRDFFFFFMPKLFYFCIYFSTCFLRYYFDIQYHCPNIRSPSCTLLKKRSEPRLNVKVAAKSRNMVVYSLRPCNFNFKAGRSA